MATLETGGQMRHSSQPVEVDSDAGQVVKADYYSTISRRFTEDIQILAIPT